MTEADWLACDDPGRVLRWLLNPGGVAYGADAHPSATDRKLRLFACACCRQAWDRLTDGRSRRAVEVAERYADGLATKVELDRAGREASPPDDARGGFQVPWWAAQSVALTEAHEAAANASEFSGVPAAAQAALLRCLVGNPWRPVAKMYAGGLHIMGWPLHTVVPLARSLYDGRDWAALPVLADALEEAGCPAEECCPQCKGYGVWHPKQDSGEWLSTPSIDCPTCRRVKRVPNPLLAHLRGPGPHARGCWALDLILGKG